MKIKFILAACLLILLLVFVPNNTQANSEWVLMDTGISVNGGVIPISMRAACGNSLDKDSEQCVIPEPEDVCVSLTAYWPFDEQGNPVPWNGQADGTPTQTANGFHITADHRNTVAAAPLPLIGGQVNIMHINATIHDTFGHEVYQHGIFWHDWYERWVLPIDILSDEPIHYLVCDEFVITKGDIEFDRSSDVIMKSINKQGVDYGRYLTTKYCGNVRSYQGCSPCCVERISSPGDYVWDYANDSGCSLPDPVYHLYPKGVIVR